MIPAYYVRFQTCAHRAVSLLVAKSSCRTNVLFLSIDGVSIERLKIGCPAMAVDRLKIGCTAMSVGRLKAGCTAKALQFHCRTLEIGPPITAPL